MLWLRDDRSLLPSSINTRLAAIKSYIGYAALCDVALSECKCSVDTVRPLKTTEKIFDVLNRDQMELLLAQAEPTKKGFRNKTIILLLYETAARISEITTLKRENLHLDTNSPYIKLDGKGKKERAVPISQDMVNCLKQYMQVYHDAIDRATEWLFYTAIKGAISPISARCVQMFLKHYATMAHQQDKNFPIRVHPHMLRRSRATDLYREGLSFEVVSGLLGHSQLETTKRYATPSLEMMKEAMIKGPLGGKDDLAAWQTQEDILGTSFWH